MEALKMNSRLPSAIIALIVAVCAIFYAGTAAAFAADIPIAAASAETPTETSVETLTVDDVWLTGDTLHIAVADKAGGGNQTLELNLSDYAKPGDEYVTIQATDSAGRVSNAIQFKNPYYAPIEDNADGDNGVNSDENGGNPANATADRAESSESAISENGAKPFTPDGTGSVVDNVMEVDGKEFFTVETPDGNTFYLIVDRQRNSENVYLLNAVTEDDLASLAKSGDGKGGSTSAVTVPETAPSSAPTETTPEPTPAPEPTKNSGNTGMLGIVMVVLIVVGGAGYYFKIVRPKKNGYDYEAEDDTDDTEADEEYDEPGEEEVGDYSTSEDEAVALEREESEASGE